MYDICGVCCDFVITAFIDCCEAFKKFCLYKYKDCIVVTQVKRPIRILNMFINSCYRNLSDVFYLPW